MRRIAHPVIAAVVGTIALNALVFGTSIGAPDTDVASGVVYRDLNNNGIRDAREPGVRGVVIATPQRSTSTNSRGQWKLEVARGEVLTVQTGWFRSQCNGANCPPGPGRDQDFAVSDQRIVTKVTSTNRRLDVGVLPDWKGGFPIPSSSRIPANHIDVGVSISFIKPTGRPGESNCYRTDDAANRACQVGDQPSFLIQIYNEGTRPITNPSGHVQMPIGTRLLSITPASLTNHPAMGVASYGVMDPTTRRIKFAFDGTLPPAGVGIYEMTLVVEPDAPITQELKTRGAYPNRVGVRVTSVARDVEGDRCTSDEAYCRWGRSGRQGFPDNSQMASFAVVPTTTDVAPLSSGRAVVPAGPTTTVPETTVPETTVPETTVPETTVPETTVPETTVPETTVPETTVPPPQPVRSASPGCSVSALLVPSCGVWFGASTASRDGSYDYVTGLAEYEAVAQNTPDILHFYKTGGVKFPTAKEISMAERPGKQRSLLLYNWKPSKTVTWRQIAQGAVDADIATVAASLKTYPHRLFLDIYHEPEDNVKTDVASGMTPQDYADMYRHVVTELRGHGVSNAVLVWNVMGYEGWASYLDALYPGDDYVDWICYDPYGKKDLHHDLGEIINRPRADLNWPGFYNWASAKAPGKPMMLCEWGVDLISNSDPASVLSGDAASLLAKYPMVKALVYWNDVDSKVNVRIDDPSPKGVAYGQAYRDLAAQPIFNAMSPDAAP